jgi:EAL domain-containing protein (putative c-di-GMP-specific phosphodiesterase class I)
MRVRDRMTLILLADSATWAADVAAEACALGLDAPVVVQTAREAIVHLAGGSPVSTLLMQPRQAGELCPALTEMTAGEADSPTRLILIGNATRRCAPAGPSAGVGTLGDDDDSPLADSAPGWLGRALAAPHPPRDVTPLQDGELHDMLLSGCLRASYQPIVSIVDRKPVGMEALARLHHPRRGILAPSTFMPQAEASGMGWMVFRLMTAIVLRDWNTHSMVRLGMKLGLNIAVAEMLRPDLPDWLQLHCAAAGVPPSLVVLEMTETQPVQDNAALRVAAARLTQLGFSLMIDDVGPGLRDPADLFDLSFAAMKVDRVLVAAAGHSADARQILLRLLRRASDAGLATVAEGVEDLETWERVRDQGFDFVQGFHAARPLPAAAVATWFRAWTAPAHMPVPAATGPASYTI